MAPALGPGALLGAARGEWDPRHRDSLLAHSGAPRIPKPPFLGTAIPQNPHSWAWVPPCTLLSGTHNPGTPSRPFRLSQPPEPHFPLPRDPPDPYSCLSQHPAPPFLNTDRHSEQHRHGATREPEMLQDRHSQSGAEQCGILGGQNLGTWEFPWKFHGWISVNPFPWKFCRWTSLPSHSHGIPWADLIPIPLPWNLMAASHRDPIPEPPDVHVSGKVEHGILTLSCHAYGFYPSTIGISWMKGMKSGIVPNRDSTFHPWPGIEALPEDSQEIDLGLAVSCSLSGRAARCLELAGLQRRAADAPGADIGGPGRCFWRSRWRCRQSPGGS
uniref:Uncharacterized protein n=1 Tax=Corvus moneduloides TaxID=1196302 RepID=A0A8U7NRA1_CORMO